VRPPVPRGDAGEPLTRSTQPGARWIHGRRCSAVPDVLFRFSINRVREGEAQTVQAYWRSEADKVIV